MIRRLLPLAVAFAAGHAAAQVAPPPASPVPPAAAPQPAATVRVALRTAAGTIVVAVETARAPITSANFLRYVDGKRLDGATFYRATKVGPGFGLIQGGVGSDAKRVLPPIAHEPTTKTGLTHGDGTISMARRAPGSATGDFFITIGAIPSMDADPKAPSGPGADALGFAAFGHIVEGMDVVRAILDTPTSPTLGEGVMKGQMLAAPVKIVTARRVADPPVPPVPPVPALR